MLTILQSLPGPISPWARIPSCLFCVSTNISNSIGSHLSDYLPPNLFPIKVNDSGPPPPFLGLQTSTSSLTPVSVTQPSSAQAANPIGVYIKKCGSPAGMPVTRALNWSPPFLFLNTVLCTMPAGSQGGAWFLLKTLQWLPLLFIKASLLVLSCLTLGLSPPRLPLPRLSPSALAPWVPHCGMLFLQMVTSSPPLRLYSKTTSLVSPS